MSQRPAPPRGMRDLLPEEVLQRRNLLNGIVSVYEQYGFQQIETPMLEDIERLVGSEGGENEKLIYKVLKRGLQWPPPNEADAVDLGLRFDLTVPLARFYATHSAEILTPFRSIQAGPVWRAERPQRGRYRQFTQCDQDIIGDPTVSAEIELLSATAEALRHVGAGDFTVRINDRRLLESVVGWAGFSDSDRGAVLIALDKVDKVGVDGVAVELAKIDHGDAADKMIGLLERLVDARGFEATLAALPSGIDDKALDSLNEIVKAVTETLPWLAVELDATLVRGMGYYTGPIFEIEHAEFSSSIAGGGRYDNMVGKILGKPMPATGFSIGFERLWDMLGARADTTGGRRRIVLLYDQSQSIGEPMGTARQLRAGGDIVRCEIMAKNRNAQLTRFAQAGFTHWLEYRCDAMLEPQPLAKDKSLANDTSQSKDKSQSMEKSSPTERSS